MITTAMYYALMAAGAVGPKPPVQIILTSGSSWPVPSDWNSANNKIECIGAGNRGGGAYARKNNLALTPGANVSYQLGVASTTQSVTNTWLLSSATVTAVGSVAGNGGAASSCIGDIAYSGGDSSGGGGSGAGGGAAGPNGAGLNAVSPAGGAGDAGFGGAGGSGPGVNGQPGLEWGTVGSGGGGGSSGGIGGLYGAGGNQSANGRPGLIVITYTPA